MFEILNPLIACVAITITMIVIVEIKIRLRKQEVEEWEAMYAPEDKE